MKYEELLKEEEGISPIDGNCLQFAIQDFDVDKNKLKVNTICSVLKEHRKYC